ncbi:IS3 family transposase [Hahella sp. SMD15-11]|uniref:IS3 family transposase n=1 Tax=Thermohahella caldifontis TaxID=3142973 RepID=A0AB39USV4_9GAMM
MARKNTQGKSTRKRYSEDFKKEALALADSVGISAAAKDLGLHESQLYNWRSKARQAQGQSEAEQQLAAENARLKRQLAQQAEELAIFKKGGGVLRQEPEVKYVFMQAHEGEFRLKTMSRVLCVSRSGYYAWRRRQVARSARQQRREATDQAVSEAFWQKKGRYGAPRLVAEMAENGHALNRKTIAKSLQRQGLRARAARKFKATTQSKHNLPVAPNLLEQKFEATAPNQKWVGDITYLWTDEGWLYLAVVIDLFSRMVVGWSMSERMTADLVCNALGMALWRRGMPEGMIVHSDRGSQYCSRDYQKLIRVHNLRCSMSAKGNCYDNACAESFFHSLKVEAIHGEQFRTREQMRRAVFEYIEVDYNRDRRHSANGNLSPAKFETLKVA